MSTTTPTPQDCIAIDQTLHSLALELADPPLADYRAFCAVVDESASATGHAVTGARR